VRQDELWNVKWVVLLLKKSSRLSADTDDGIPCGDDDEEPPAGVATDCCEVRLVTQVILVSCRRQRFCASCVEEVHAQGPGCPLCRTLSMCCGSCTEQQPAG